ncbi:MAG: LamG domain-containing protein [Candidatus Kaelpia imicola]|nr:LamG domain-containing protein [Candidatus Kaelpia imicola]
MVLSLSQNYRYKISSTLSREQGVTFVSAVILVAVMSLSIWASLVLSDVILKAKSVGTTESEMEIIAEGLLNFYRDCDQFITDTGVLSTDFLDLETQPLAPRFEGTPSLQSYRQSAWDGPYVRGGYDEDKDGDTVDFIQEYFKDAWNKTYIYDYTAGATSATITSYGLNRATGGGDDIVVTVTADGVVEEKIRKTKEELAYINARKEELETRYDNAGETWPPVGFDIDSLFSTYGCDTTGLVSHWKMDEAVWSGVANEVVDSVGTNHGTGQPTGASYTGPTTVFTGKLGRCGSFDGTDDYVNSINVDSWIRTVNDITVTGWYYHNADTNGAPWYILTNTSPIGSADGFWWHIKYTGNIFYLRTEDNVNGESDGTGTPFVSENTWYHIATVVGEDKFHVYVNGDIYWAWTPNNDFSWANINSDTAYFGIGRSYNIGSDCKLDEVRIWSRPLTPADIFQEYLRGPYLTDWAYKYDEWQSEYAWDSGDDVFYSFGPDRVTGSADDIYQSE